MSLSDLLKQKYNLLTILGPTASGKTSFAAKTALLLNTEVISADSRQVYRKMDIGTGKDKNDYIIKDTKVPYNLIDILNAGEKYNIYRFQNDFFKIYQDLVSQNKIPVMCGGSGLYIDAIVNNYNLINVPENKLLRIELENKDIKELSNLLASFKTLHNTSDIDSKKRVIRALEIEYYLKENPKSRTNYPQINSLNIGIKFDRQKQKNRITERLKTRLQEGMIEEIRDLIDSGVSSETLIYYGLEYKFVTLYILKQISYEEMFDKLNIAIHQFSKRQMTWFRRMEKRGQKIYWLDGNMNDNEKIERIKNIISDKNKIA